MAQARQAKKSTADVTLTPADILTGESTGFEWLRRMMQTPLVQGACASIPRARLDLQTRH